MTINNTFSLFHFFLMLPLLSTEPDSQYFPCSSGCSQDTCSQVTRLIDHTHSSLRARLQLLRVQACNYALLFNLLCFIFPLRLLTLAFLVTRLLNLWKDVASLTAQLISLLLDLMLLLMRWDNSTLKYGTHLFLSFKHITKVISVSLLDTSYREAHQWQRDWPGGARRESKPIPDTKGL